MPRIGACLVIAALAAAIVTPLPTSAVGRPHFGFLGFRLRIAHRHHMAPRIHARRRTSPARPRPVQAGAGVRPGAVPPGAGAVPPGAGAVPPGVAAVPPGAAAAQPGGEVAKLRAAALYPGLVVPSVAADVFQPDRSSPWPFSYDDIFRTAFSKSLPVQDAQSCQPAGLNGPAGLIVARMQSDLKPDAAQQQLLQRLGGALGMASAVLAKACPPGIPPQPVARLQLMQAQVEALTMAIDLIRPPLQQLEQSLTAEQRARFAAAPSQSAGAIACGTATSPDWSIDQISQSVQPADGQRDALADLRKAFGSAARDLDTHCPRILPPDPLTRLETIEARLDASWRTVLGMQVALASFESRLTDSQRTRFEAMNVAEAR